jgi:pimeloyl-ACP methyl ester carboxylesterase
LKPFADVSTQTIGELGVNNAWPGVLSTVRSHFHSNLRDFHRRDGQLRFTSLSYRPDFLYTLDLPVVWWSPELPNMTARRAGSSGAGSSTYLLTDDVGHFVVHDQPAPVKEVVRRWIGDIG